MASVFLFGYLNRMLHIIFIRYYWQFDQSKAKYILYNSLQFCKLDKLSELCYLLWFITGNLYMTGGWKHGRASNETRVINVSSQGGTITKLPPMVESQCIHATAAVGKFVFAFGGINEQNDVVSSCEFYDPATNTWVKWIQYKTNTLTRRLLHMTEGTLISSYNLECPYWCTMC